ncbi:MAG: hypothetical protein WAP39_07180 [Bacillota bacterium]|jgi:uncharacterized protein (DUF58 family)
MKAAQMLLWVGAAIVVLMLGAFGIMGVVPLLLLFLAILFTGVVLFKRQLKR